MPIAKSIKDLLDPLSGSLVASATIQGAVLEFKIHFGKSTVPTTGRGIIKDLSQGARLRMMKTFQKINFTDHCAPLFLTLTYPDALATPNLKTRNMHRQHMARRLERITGAILPAAWRVEWMPRKSGAMIGTIAPHWHWLIFRHEYISYQKINEAWKQTIGYQNDVITYIQRVDKASAVQMYMAKYISKDSVSPSLVIAAYHTTIGRQYGWLRKRYIPMETEHIYTNLSDEQRGQMMRLAEEQLPWMNVAHEGSFTLFGQRAHDAQRILAGERLDK